MEAYKSHEKEKRNAGFQTQTPRGQDSYVVSTQPQPDL